MTSASEQTSAIDLAIKRFEELKNKSTTLKDVIYLDGVLAVLDTCKKKCPPDELELAVNSPSFVNPQLEDEVFSRPSPQQQPDTQEYKCADCGTSINEGEFKTFGVCDDCWDKHHTKVTQGQPDELSKAQARVKELQYELRRLIYGYRVSKIENLHSEEWQAIYVQAEEVLNKQS